MFDFDAERDAALVAKVSGARKDKNLRKYWRQRYSLFSRFDEGVLLDHGICL